MYLGRHVNKAESASPVTDVLMTWQKANLRSIADIIWLPIHEIDDNSLDFQPLMFDSFELFNSKFGK
jgi:hypothetical protein